MPDTRARVDFLKKLHLFRSLSDEQLTSVAEEMQEISYPEADTVFAQGTPADSLYLIYQGRVTITRHTKKKDVKIATLVRGDYFGEQGLLTGKNRSATVKADKGTLLLMLPRERFRRLLRKIPSMRPNFEIMISSRKLAAEMNFKWLDDDEVIYFMARKHIVLLYQSLAIPGLLMLPVLGLLIAAIFLNSLILAGIGGILGLINLGWMIWKYVDWSNDYYIVTNERVISLEKVVGLYDSRNEANMNTILSINTETNYWGRTFDYGTVVVRTYTGQIRMEYVGKPKQAGAMFEEYWGRTKDIVRSNEQEGIKKAIRAKLGPAPASKPAAAAASAAKPKSQTFVSALGEWWSGAFKVRFEEKGNVTYRKHIFVLFRDTLFHNIAFIVLIASPILWTLFLGSVPPLWVFLGMMLGLVIDAMLWAYEYVDWSNDIYQVTAEQIIDISRKPFGDENRKAAPLESILSTEYKRIGLPGLIFNFGTVFIMVGGAQFNFENVADPPTVQQDIVRRQQVRTQKKKDAETAGERERLAEWLAMYHRTVEEIERERNQSRPGNPE